MNMNVVLLTDCLADLAGGAEKQIFELARGLDKKRFNVTIASLDCYGQTPRTLIESAGCRLEVFRVVRIYGITGLIQGLRFFRFLKQNKIDLLQTYHFSSDIWGTFWARLAGVPVIVSNRRDMGFWRNRWHVATYRLINPWVHKMVVNARSIKDMMVQTEAVAPDKITVIYNGVGQKNSIDYKREDFGFASDDLIVMHVANLKPVKAHKTLFKAIAPLVSRFPKLKLVLVGKDELNGALERLAQELNIQNHVLFLGKREDVASLLTMTDICVLPSLSEGLSNAIMEYMMAAKPVVATSVGGNPELVDNGVTGWLVEKDNVEQLRQAIEKLFAGPVSRLKMGENGKRKIDSQFSMRAMIQNYEQLFLSKR